MDKELQMCGWIFCGASQQCITNFYLWGWYLRKDEEEGGRADQEAGGRAHRDEGAGLQRVGAAGGHPVLRALIRVPSRAKTAENSTCRSRFVRVSPRTESFINL